LGLFSCEKEGEGLMPEDFINQDIQDALYKPFFARVDGYAFNGKSINAEYNGSQLVIIGNNNNKEQIVLVTNGYKVGTYIGNSTGANQIYYASENEFFFSFKPNEENKSIVRITEYDEVESSISGVFNAELYIPNTKKVIRITEGQFNDLYVEIPFLGKMTAVYEGEQFFSENCTYVSTSNQGATIETIQAIGKNDSTSFTISIREPLAATSYYVSDPKVSVTYNSNIYSSAIETKYIEQTGIVDINEINQQEGVVKGSFNVELQNFNGNTLNFQMGNFEAKYN
jgi:hypothetical protein